MNIGGEWSRRDMAQSAALPDRLTMYPRRVTTRDDVVDSGTILRVWVRALLLRVALIRLTAFQLGNIPCRRRQPSDEE